MRIRSFIIIAIFTCSIGEAFTQQLPVEITNVSRYHFKITNLLYTDLDIYLGEDAGTSGLQKSFTLKKQGAVILLKSQYGRGTILQVMESAYEPVFVWDFIERGGVRLTPFAEISFGIPVYKSSLSSNWKGKGNNFQYDIHVSYSPFPEIRLGRKSFSRLYLSFDHEVYSHVLGIDNNVFLTDEHVKSGNQERYRVTDHDYVSVNLKYYNLGVYHRFFFLPGMFFDLGVRVPVQRNSYVDFRNDDNVVPNDLTNPRAEPTDPKIRNKATFFNEPFEDLIFFSKIGFFGKNKGAYSPVLSDINVAFSIQLMNTRLQANSDFPVVFDNPDTPSGEFVPVSTDRGSSLYYVASVHLSYPITRN